MLVRVVDLGHVAVRLCVVKGVREGVREGGVGGYAGGFSGYAAFLAAAPSGAGREGKTQKPTCCYPSIKDK